MSWFEFLAGLGLGLCLGILTAWERAMTDNRNQTTSDWRGQPRPVTRAANTRRFVPSSTPNETQGQGNGLPLRFLRGFPLSGLFSRGVFPEMQVVRVTPDQRLALLPSQLWIGEQEPRHEVMAVVVNRAFVWHKPELGGLWTSTYDAEIGSDWVRWSVGEEFRVTDPVIGWVLTPRPAKVLTIDSYADLVTAAERYGLPKYPDRPDMGTGLDFEAISQDYEAVHLTDRGVRETHLSLPLDLYGWDCESTLWYRWERRVEWPLDVLRQRVRGRGDSMSAEGGSGQRLETGYVQTVFTCQECEKQQDLDGAHEGGVPPRWVLVDAFMGTPDAVGQRRYRELFCSEKCVATTWVRRADV